MNLLAEPHTVERVDLLTYLFSQLHWYDLLDILVVTYIVVWLYSWVKGTPGFRVLLGLGLVVLVYLWAQWWELLLTRWALQWLGQALIIFVIIIFAPEIRQVLEQLNPLRIWNRPHKESTDFLEEIVEASKYLGEHRVGALLVLERSDPLGEHIRSGIPFGSEVRKEILVSIFQVQSPLHDGAAWIRRGQIHQVGVFLPISKADLPLYYGSRHRAAVGLSEASDALVLAISEERGEVSFAENGKIEKVGDLSRLGELLKKKLSPLGEIPRPTWRTVVLKEWRVKLVTLFFVAAVWLAVAGQAPDEQNLPAAIRFVNLPEQYRVSSPQEMQASVRVTGPRRVLARLDAESLEMWIDLARVSQGRNSLALEPDQVTAPPEVIITQVEPAFIQLDIEAKRE